MTNVEFLLRLLLDAQIQTHQLLEVLVLKGKDCPNAMLDVVNKIIEQDKNAIEAATKFLKNKDGDNV